MTLIGLVVWKLCLKRHLPGPNNYSGLTNYGINMIGIGLVVCLLLRDKLTSTRFQYMVDLISSEPIFETNVIR